MNRYEQEEADERAAKEADWKVLKRAITIGSVALVCLIAFATSCTSIDSGHVGVVKHFGAIQSYTLNEGINFTRPWPLADAVTNFDFSHEFNVSIESKVKAEQDALRAENEKRTKVTQAEAAAKEATLAADATAYKTEVESKARASAIERESKALEQSPNLIQLRIAERWDGKLPTYTGNSIPMLQLKP